jgi:tRNA A37 N6-isopentenylltransferase MiaA
LVPHKLCFKPRLVVILGPTGAGKTEMAISLASEWGGEIISADSMQVYRLMDIGTSKPSFQERARVRHHLVDVVDPDESFNTAMFKGMAADVIEILQAEKKPIRLMKRDTKRYAKRQMTWFGADKEIEWFSPAEVLAVNQRVSQFLRGTGIS